MHSMGKKVLSAALLRSLLCCPFEQAVWDQIVGDHLHLRIGNTPAITDRGAAFAALEGFFARVRGFGCDYWQAWRAREALFAETDVSFMARTGKDMTIPCGVVARIADAELVDLRFHLDPSPIP